MLIQLVDKKGKLGDRLKCYKGKKKKVGICIKTTQFHHFPFLQSSRKKKISLDVLKKEKMMMKPSKTPKLLYNLYAVLFSLVVTQV